MRLTKSQSRVIAVGLILVFFAGGIWFIQRQEKPALNLAGQDSSAPSGPLPGSPSGAGSASAGAALTEQPAKFALSDFQRAEIKDGRKVWEVKAAEGSYSPENSSANLKKAKLWLYGKGNEVVELEAGSAKLFVDGASLSKAELFDGVKVVRNNEVTIETDRAVFDKVNNKIHAPGAVKLTSEGMDISENKLEVDITTREVRLLENVDSVIRRRPDMGRTDKR
jgi:LPS export ABC transporter protein LptC